MKHMRLYSNSNKYTKEIINLCSISFLKLVEHDIFFFSLQSAPIFSVDEDSFGDSFESQTKDNPELHFVIPLLSVNQLLESVCLQALLNWELDFSMVAYYHVFIKSGTRYGVSSWKNLLLHATWCALQGNGPPLWGTSDGKAAEDVYFDDFTTETGEVHDLISAKPREWGKNPDSNLIMC